MSNKLKENTGIIQDNFNKYLEKIDIDNGFLFYNIDDDFKQRCYECAEDINKNYVYLATFNKVYQLLSEESFDEIKKLWEIKDVEEMFCKGINPYVTNLMVILNYKNHEENMEKHKLSEEQINIHKCRVKECFENDLVNRHYYGIRVSQMLWAIYFIRVRLIEIGRLQYEYLNTINEVSQIKIHIPVGSRLDTKLVSESIKKSKQLLPQIFSMNEMDYLCDSWLLSNQLNDIVDHESNIHKFYELFEVVDGDDCIDDILNFVYQLRECRDYNKLQENTSLQKLIKQNLLNDKVFKLGIGKLK